MSVVLGIRICVRNDDLVTASAFCLIQCHIRSPQKDINGIARFPFGDAYAARDGDRLVTTKDFQPFDAQPKLLCDIECVREIAFCQECKFLTAQSAGNSGQQRYLSGNTLEHDIPRVMAVNIVDLFEMIEINHYGRQYVPGLRLRDGLCGVFEKSTSVG